MSYVIVILVPALLAVFYFLMPDVTHAGAKALFALLWAFRFFQEIPLVSGSGLLNYILWLAILLAINFSLFWLPRTNRCVHFTCAYFFVAMVGLIVADLLIGWFASEAKLNTMHFLLLFLVSGLGSGITPIRKEPDKDFSNPVLRGFDRTLASAVMGITLAYMGTQVFSYVEGTPFFWALTAGIAAAWFVIDLFAFGFIRKLSGDKVDEAAVDEAAVEAYLKEYEQLSPEEKKRRAEESRQNMLTSMRNRQIIHEIFDAESKAQIKQLRKEEKERKAKEREKEARRRERDRERRERDRDRELQRELDRQRANENNWYGGW